MLQISPTTYINPFLLDAVLSRDNGEDILYTSTEGKLYREAPSKAQLASAGFISFGNLYINKLRISRLLVATNTIVTMSGYIFEVPGANLVATASQLSYKEVRPYGYEVPGLQYVYTSTQPSNISGLPPELEGATTPGASEMQFIGLYPNDIPTTTVTEWDVVQNTLTPTEVGPGTFYVSTSYIEAISSGGASVVQPTAASTHYSVIAVHSTDITPEQVFNHFSGVAPIEHGELIIAITYDAATLVQHTIDGLAVDNYSTSPISELSLLDGIVYTDGTELGTQPTSGQSLTVTAIHISMTDTPLEYVYTANAVKPDSPLTTGYYISSGTNTYMGVTFYDGEAIIFVDGQNPLVIQDYGMRSQFASSLLDKFITSGSAIIDLIASEPGSEGWYINYQYIGNIPPGRVIYVDSSLELSYFDPPVGLTAVLVKNQIAYRMVCNYIGGTDSTLLNAPPNWHTSIVATPTILDNTESNSVSIYTSRSNMHIIQAGGGSLTLSFIAEGDVGFNSYMKGTIIVIGSNNADTYIDFPDVSGNQPYPRGVGGSSNYIVFEYQYIAGEVHILQAVPRISNSLPIVFEKSTATLVGPDWWKTTELGPDVSHITITNNTNASGNLIIDFGNSLKHKPRELAFILSGNDMNGDLIIAASDGNVTFTTPIAGSIHKVFLGGPVGLTGMV